MRISDWSSDVCSSDLFRVLWRGPLALRVMERFYCGGGNEPAWRRDGGLLPERPSSCLSCHRPWLNCGILGCQARIPCPVPAKPGQQRPGARSEEHTSELQSLMRISYAVFCLKK